MSSTEASAVAGNEEAISAWDGVLFDRSLEYRHIYVRGLAAHGDEALRTHPPQPGWRVPDIGGDLGDTTQAIAQAVGPGGEAVGVDAARKMLDLARVEALESALAPGPAAEIVRLWGDRMAHRHDAVRAALREVVEGPAREDGPIAATASTWIVSATNPGAARTGPPGPLTRCSRRGRTART